MIKLRLDSPYSIKYEELSDFQSSIFRDVYRNASEMVTEIINKNSSTKSGRDERFSRGEQICNVIAFMGRRGSGKSSALASYCKFLDGFYRGQKSYNDVMQKKMDPEVIELLELGNKKKISFTVLDTMDATLLDTEEKIVEIVLARMLEVIDDQEKSNRSKGDYRPGEDKGRALIAEIGKIYQYFVGITRDERNVSVLQLRELSHSWNAREAFQKLVRGFNDYMGGIYGNSQEGNNYVVIPIDDIDMNVEKCREMLEMIRKYLMVPRVIIMLTFNFEQLSIICRNHYYNELFCQYGYKNYDDLAEKDREQIQELTREYIDKVIPIGRKIYMPQLYQMESFKNREIKVTGNYLEGLKEQTMGPATFVCAAIRYYTGIICLDKDKNPYIYPVTIRRLCNYMKEFLQMKRIVGVDEGEIEKNFNHNMDWLYDDISNRFLDQYVEESDARELWEYLNEVPEKQRRHFAKLIQKIISQDSQRYEKEMDIIENMLREKEMVFGNLLLVLCIARVHNLVRSNSLFAWHMFLSIQKARETFNGKNIVPVERSWGDLDNWFWREKGESKAVDMRLENKIRMSEAFQSEELAGTEEEKRKVAESTLLIYSMIRLFFVPEKRMQGGENGENHRVGLPNSINVGLSERQNWQFSMGGWLFYMWDFDDVLEKIKEEFETQCKDQSINISGTEEILKNKMNAWREKYGKKKITPYTSSLFMEEIIERFYFEEELKEADGFQIEVCKFLDIIKEELSKLDQQIEWEQGKSYCEGTKSEICFGGCAQAFADCPIIMFLQGKWEGKEKETNAFYEWMKKILNTITDKEAEREDTEAALSSV